MQGTGYLEPKYLFLLVFILSINNTFPQKYPDEQVHLFLKSGTEEIINHDYEAARKIFQKLDVSYPELPLGDIYLAATEITRSFDLGIPFKTDFIEEKLDSARIKIKVLLADNPDNLWYHYFSGLGEGYSAYYYAIQGDWYGAFSKGVDAVANFENCLFYDSTFYESFVAIGTFKYWKSSKLNFLSWLPFINDERETGIEMLEEALDYSEYNHYLSANSLIWIYIDQKKYEMAVSTATGILKDYPDSRIFKWGLARAFQESDPERAIRIYYEILNSYKKPSTVNEVTLKHKIAQLELQLGKRESALDLCEDILSITMDEEYSKEILGSRLKRVQILYEELKN
jgi:tetratricopeptide (TPR) repeat protein